jgi:hypothetical protein
MRKEYFNKYNQEHREERRRYQLENRKRLLEKHYRTRKAKRQQVNEYKGSSCWSCGWVGTLQLHEINGLNHEIGSSWCYLSHLERFIVLCDMCHQTFHALMKCRYSLEEILKILKWEEY